MQPDIAMEEIQHTAVLSLCDALDLEFSSGHEVEIFYTNSSLVRDMFTMSCKDEALLFSTSTASYIPILFKDMDVDVGLYRGDGSLISKAVANSEGIYYTSFPYSFVLQMPQGTLPEGNFKFVM